MMYFMVAIFVCAYFKLLKADRVTVFKLMVVRIIIISKTSVLRLHLPDIAGLGVLTRPLCVYSEEGKVAGSGTETNIVISWKYTN